MKYKSEMFVGVGGLLSSGKGGLESALNPMVNQCDYIHLSNNISNVIQ